MKSFSAPYLLLHLGAFRAATHHHFALAARSLRGHGGSREEEHGQTGREREWRVAERGGGARRTGRSGITAAAAALVTACSRQNDAKRQFYKKDGSAVWLQHNSE